MKKILTLSLLAFASLWASAQPYVPTKENLEARTWFQDAKFGLFIHWGVYSILGDGEWVMHNQKIPVKTYEKLPGAFNPTQYDPAEWVAMAKKAGMKYITITSKHHDGFAMWDSKVSDYNIVDQTPYKKDVLKMLADECQKQGIKLFFYHSHLDWHHPDYFPDGMTGKLMPDRPTYGEFNRYLDYMDAQLTELLTNYGPIAGIWFDGWWDQKKKGQETFVDWRLRQTYDLIHRLQPACLIGNNHHVTPFAGEDFQMFERDLPGFNSTGWSGDQTVSQLPLEYCETMNGAWGFNLMDQKFKSPKELVHLLVKSAGYNSNFLLNVGPMSNGKIQPEFVQALEEVGKWMDKNSESIHGTRGGPIAPQPWGVTTRKGSKVYVHLLDWQHSSITIPDPGFKVKTAKLLTGAAVKFRQDEMGLSLQISGALDPIDTIVVLE